MTPEFGHPRTAIVTGGAKRIGAAFVRALAADGWSPLIHYNHSGDEAVALAAELGGAATVQADLAESDAGTRVAAALRGLPPPGLLVNSASRFELDGFADFTAEGWQAHMAANLRGPALVTRAFVEAVPTGMKGLVVNMLDAKLAAPNPDFFSYTISKMGLAGLTELCARVLAGRDIRVCAIAPSVTLVSGPQSRENFERVHRLNARGRGVEVDELVAALRFLIASPTITGETIRLDAGQRFLNLARDVQFLSDDPA